MTIKDEEKKVEFLQYLNTTILTIIGILAIFIYTSVSDVKKQQVDFGAELLRIKTIQDINTTNISLINSRVSTLEKDNLIQFQAWVDQNYIRKPQQK
jgi:hypothetical protein